METGLVARDTGRDAKANIVSPRFQGRRQRLLTTRSGPRHEAAVVTWRNVLSCAALLGGAVPTLALLSTASLIDALGGLIAVVLIVALVRLPARYAMPVQRTPLELLLLASTTMWILMNTSWLVVATAVLLRLLIASA